MGEALAPPHFFWFYFLRTKTFAIPLEALLLPPRRCYWYLEGGSSSATSEISLVRSRSDSTRGRVLIFVSLCTMHWKK